MRVSRRFGVGSHDYFELVDSRGVRRTWRWVTDGAEGYFGSREFDFPASMTLTTDSPSSPADAPDGVTAATSVTLKYFTNGGWLTAGTLANTTTVELANPLRRLSATLHEDEIVAVVDVAPDAVSSSFGSLVVLSSASVRIGLRTADFADLALSAHRDSLSQRVAFRRPRVGGEFSVSFRTGDGKFTLGRWRIDVAAKPFWTQQAAVEITNAPGAGESAVAVVPPGATVRFTVQGGLPMAADDALFVHQTEPRPIRHCFQPRKGNGFNGRCNAPC